MKRVARTPETQARHPIAVVAARTGLTPDVLRVWERRYDAVQPTRSENGQRLYSDADVERLRGLRSAMSAGRSIGQVARLSPEALAKLIAEDEAARTTQRVDGDVSVAGEVAAEVLKGARALDAHGVSAALRRASALHGVSAFLEDIAVHVLQRLGEEWHGGRLTPAQEHLASSVIESLIIEALRDLNTAGDAPRVLVATPAGDRHSIGAALIGAWAAAHGWNVIYLGADLPADEIVTSAVSARVSMVALSMVYIDDRKRTLSELRVLRKRLPADIGVIVGGAGAVALHREIRQLGIDVGGALSDLR